LVVIVFDLLQVIAIKEEGVRVAWIDPDQL
jgi:hypothetical protein